MAHKLYKIIDFRLVDVYTVWVAFDDGGEQTIDLEPLLVGSLFGSLRDPEFFAQVALNPIAHTLARPWAKIFTLQQSVIIGILRGINLHFLCHFRPDPPPTFCKV